MVAKQDNFIRFSFNFDLDIAKLKESYPSDNPDGYKKAWTDIKQFMEANEFTHSQYSGYESVNEILYADAYATLEKLQSKFPWFLKCAQVATLTEIGERYDVLEHLNEQSHHKYDISHPVTKSKVSLLDEVSSMRDASKELSNETILNHDELER